MSQVWKSTKWEREQETEDGRWHLVAEKDGVSGWTVSVSLSGIPMKSSIGLKTPGEAFDIADDFVAAYKPHRK